MATIIPPISSTKGLFFFGAGASAPFGIPTMKAKCLDLGGRIQKNRFLYNKQAKRSLKQAYHTATARKTIKS